MALQGDAIIIVEERLFAAGTRSALGAAWALNARVGMEG